MNWDAAEAAIKAYAEAQWALSAFASVKLFWENETWIEGQDRFLYLDIQAVFSEKSIFGSATKRMSIEHGLVFIHAFTEQGVGKQPALQMLVAMNQILEIKSISSVIDLEGAAPPSPVESDSLIAGKPGGNYFRCSSSVPFIVRSNI
jgi:hypothetical protein